MPEISRDEILAGREIVCDESVLIAPSITHVPKFNRMTRRVMAKKLGSSHFELQSWQTIHRKTIDKDGVEHNSHSHTFSFLSSERGNHQHSATHTTSDACGYQDAAPHYHWCQTDPGGVHTHSISGTTSVETATDLNHTHTISSGVVAGGGHSHVYDCTDYWANCDKCVGNKHLHGNTGSYASVSNHGHTLTGSTGTGTGTLQSHTHSISLTTGSASTHTHGAGSGTSATNGCYKGWDHHHHALTAPAANSHTHTVVGDTDLDGEPIFAPTVTTQAADPVGTTTATGKGTITDTGGENCDKRGIVYGTTSKGDPGAAAPPSGYDAYEEQAGSFGTGAFTRSLTGLIPGRTYYARAYAHNSAGYNYGGEVSFTTLSALGGKTAHMAAKMVAAGLI